MKVWLQRVERADDGSFDINPGDRIVSVEWYYPSATDDALPLYVWVIDASVSEVMA